MNTSHVLPFSRRSILRVAAILVLGYAFTVIAIQLWAQDTPPAADGWVPVSDGPRAGSHGFAASDGLTVSAASTVHSSTANSVAIAYRPGGDARAAVPRIAAFQSSMPGTSRTAKPQFMTGLSGRGFYSYP